MIDKSSQLIFFHAKKENGITGCKVQLWLNIYLPDGSNLQVTPESSNDNSIFGYDNTFTRSYSMFSFGR